MPSLPGAFDGNIRSMPLAELQPASYNPRRALTPADPEYRALKRSIEMFGNVQPLVWNRRTEVLVGGHQRLQVLKDMGVTDTAVVVVDLSPEDERALNVALNKVEGEWDMPKLADLLLDLKDSDFDATATGFNTQEIDALLAGLSTPTFAPVTEPELSNRIVTEADMTRAQERLDDRFTAPQQIIEVHCPDCGHQFGINPQ